MITYRWGGLVGGCCQMWSSERTLRCGPSSSRPSFLAMTSGDLPLLFSHSVTQCSCPMHLSFCTCLFSWGGVFRSRRRRQQLTPICMHADFLPDLSLYRNPIFFSYKLPDNDSSWSIHPAVFSVYSTLVFAATDTWCLCCRL